jgi:phospholipid/cholesterol/gamma-HCH transport system substrate-binding protein
MKVRAKVSTMSSGRVPRWRLLAVAFLTLLGTIGVGLQLIDGPDSEGMKVQAVFTDVSPLLVGNEVKVDGVKVGLIEEIELANGKAIVEMALQPEALPLHTDARATIRPVSLLGERFIDLDRGSPKAPALKDGAVIPVARTGRNTDLDEVLNTVDQPTGAGLAALIATLGDGLRDNGRNADLMMARLAPAMGDVELLLSVLEEQNQLLNSVIDNVQPVAAALATDEGRTMDQLMSSANLLLGVTADQQEAFEAALAELPSTLDQARSTLAVLTGTAEATTPTLRALRPTTDNLTAISHELERFAASADSALTHAEPVLRKAQELLDEAQPVVAELRKAGPDVTSSVTSADAVVTSLTENLDGVMGFIKNWALSSNGHDGVSHYFRALVVGTGYSATGAIPLPAGPENNQPNLPIPGTPPLGDGLLDLLGDLTPGLLSGLTQPNGGVTGLSPQQESGVLEFLLGGS